MDSNTSKNTNSHKFFKLWFNYEKPAISLHNLLKQKLLIILNSDRQSLGFSSKLESLDTLINRQLILLSFERQRSLLQSNNWQVSVLGLSSFCYSFPIGLILAPRLQISPQQVVENLGNLLTLHSSTKSSLLLYLCVDPLGWLNFYATEQAIASWLERSLWLSKTQNNHSLLKQSSDRFPRSNLFSVQYVHARCCGLLRLGAKEKLITLSNNNFDDASCQISQPASIFWLDQQHHLWFDRQSEYNLLRQLLIVTDFQIASDSDKWSKLAIDLGQITAIFLADCRFLGEIKEQSRQKAIARLGLIALAQYWLQKILVEKLNTAAPTTL